jgi:hypothetical protein
MSKNRFRTTIAGGAVLVSLLGGAGYAYATGGAGGGQGCGTAPTLTKAVGPNGTTSADTTKGAEDGPLCVAPVAPVLPVSP